MLSNIIFRNIVFFYIIFVFFLYNGCDHTRQFARTPVSGEEIRTVAILPFGNFSDHPYAGEILTHLFYTQLYSEKKFRIVDLNTLKTKLNIKPQTDINDYLCQHTVKETAQILGADAIIAANVTEFKYKEDIRKKPVVGIDLKLIAAKTSDVLWAGSYTREELSFMFYQGSLNSVSQKVCANIARELVKSVR